MQNAQETTAFTCNSLFAETTDRKIKGGVHLFSRERTPLGNFVKFYQDALSAEHLRETDSLCIEVLAEHVKAFRISRSDPKT